MAVSSTSIKDGQVANPNGRPVSEASRLRLEMRDADKVDTRNHKG